MSKGVACGDGKRRKLASTQIDEINDTRLIAETINSKEKKIRRLADGVLRELMYRCIACGYADCIGECVRGCYRCGDRYHQTNACSYNIQKLSVILANKGVCFGCFDSRQRGIQSHDIRKCPLKRRLKRLLFLDKEKRQGSFECYLRNLYADDLSLTKMIASFSDKIKFGR